MDKQNVRSHKDLLNNVKSNTLHYIYCLL